MLLPGTLSPFTLLFRPPAALIAVYMVVAGRREKNSIALLVEGRNCVILCVDKETSIMTLLGQEAFSAETTAVIGESAAYE